MGMSTGGSSSVMNDINVTPMVDVMLVLLIIFMVVMPTIMAGFQATLPVGDNLKSRPEEEGRVEMGIDINGNYYLEKKPIGKDVIQARLSEMFAERPLDKVLFLKADINLPYSDVVEAMQLARRAGARVVAAVSEPKGPPPDLEGAH
jgi:biopolymer transport protein ExbD